MNILLHDFGGHPFQVALSRSLSRRGHVVKHVYFADDPGPKGAFISEGVSNLEFIGISVGPCDRRALLARRFADVRYGHAVARLIAATKPDVVISGNTPTEAQSSIVKACKSLGIRFVYWVQDVYSIAAGRLLARRFGPIGWAVGAYYEHLDRRQYRASDAIVVITDDFVPVAAKWSGQRRKVSVIENWASVDELPMMPKQNAWAAQHGLEQKFAYLYCGTLGRKHNPELLLALADATGGTDVVCAVGQGTGFDKLKQASIASLWTLPLQPVSVLPAVLASADVLIASIEADASNFAVPSKVLSYLCAGRAILLCAPRSNLSARIVERAEAGVVVQPGDVTGFLGAASALRRDERLRSKMGSNGRKYAERTFDLDKITDSFERVLEI